MGVAKRVLITGVSGFTGGYVRAELEASGWEVYGTGMHEVPEDHHYRRADLSSEGEVREVVAEIQPHAVVHLAGIAFVGHGDAEAFYRVNLLGTRNLLAALAGEGRGLECVILASSANIYGNATGGMLDEDTSPNPANDYAVSKLAMEYMARLWMDRLPVVIVRPFNYTGVGQAEVFLIPKIVSHFIRRADTIELGNVDVSRDFSDVRDVARAYRRLLDVCPAGKTVNICSGRAYSIRHILKMCKDITGHSLHIKTNPAFIRANDVKTLCGDPAKLREVIGDWTPRPLRETLVWMLDQGAR
ncbi:MAG: GDP-mannose 4,6-dehydratase [Deltaproteobacteria bacterium]